LAASDISTGLSALKQSNRNGGEGDQPEILADQGGSRVFMEFAFPGIANGLISKRRDVNVQHGGLAVVERSEAAINGCSEIVRLGDAFAVCAECPRYGGESRCSP